MNISKYIIHWPYRIGWSIAHLFRKNKEIHFYCAGHVDYVIIESILKHFPEARIVAKNRKVQKELKSHGIDSLIYPTFPDILIMPRHTARKFPEKRMKKIGLRHGAYHFKDFVQPYRYHAFDLYFVTSQKEVELARKKGIKNTVDVGFPKLDPVFQGKYTPEILNDYKSRLKIDNNKAIVIFTTTWSKSGMSAIDRWIDELSKLVQNYNVLVTVHHWTEQKYKKTLQNTAGIQFINDKNIIPYLLLADVMIADMSSIIAEFCALNKPIITFRVPDQRRTSKEIKDMLEQISVRIDTFEELEKILPKVLKNPKKLEPARLKYNKIMFDELDGKAGERAAQIIREKFLS